MRTRALVEALLLTVLIPGLAAASEQSERLYSRGLVELHAGRTLEAHAAFERAVAADPDDAIALYYRGVAAGRLGDWEAAARDLDAVVERRPQTERAPLELAHALIRLGRYDEARPWLARARTNPALASEAARLEAEIAASAAGDGSGAPRYALYASAGFEYDSNVALAPSDDAAKLRQAVDEDADGRAVLTAGGRYAVIRRPTTVLAVGYEIFQSLHLDYSEFDVQDHRLSADLGMGSGILRYGALMRYDYYLVDFDSYLEQATLEPWLAVLEGEFGRTEVFYRLRDRDFRDDLYEVLSGTEHVAGLRQYIYFGAPEYWLVGGYAFERDDAGNNGDHAFAYDGHRFDAGLGWTLPSDIEMETGYSYKREDYDADSDGRDDQEHRVGLSLRRQMANYVWLRLGYFGLLNESDKDDFEYDRHVASIAVEVRS